MHARSFDMRVGKKWRKRKIHSSRCEKFPSMAHDCSTWCHGMLSPFMHPHSHWREIKAPQIKLFLIQNWNDFPLFFMPKEGKSFSQGRISRIELRWLHNTTNDLGSILNEFLVSFLGITAQSLYSVNTSRTYTYFKLFFSTATNSTSVEWLIAHGSRFFLRRGHCTRTETILCIFSELFKRLWDHSRHLMLQRGLIAVPECQSN